MSSSLDLSTDVHYSLVKEQNIEISFHAETSSA